MSDEQTDEAPGWRVIDPDGNVVAQGPLAVAQPVFAVGESTEDSEEQE